MSAKFITGLVAAGALVASLATASPVQAGQNDDFKRFLGAAVGLYILGQALDGQHRSKVVTKSYGHKSYGHKSHGKKKWHHKKRKHHCGGKHNNKCGNRW